MTYGESNDHVTDDVTWPERSGCDPNTVIESISRKQLVMLF